MGVEITTNRLRLRPLEMTDAPRIHALAGNFEVARWLARAPHPYPEGAAEAFVADCLDKGAHVWAIEPLGEPLEEPGLIGVIGIEGEPVREVLGYWIGQPFWGRGYASEAARAVVGWAFAELRLDGIRSGVFEGNDASLRVQEKLGFRATGRRMIACRSLGEDQPHIDTVLSRADWADWQARHRPAGAAAR